MVTMMASKAMDQRAPTVLVQIVWQGKTNQAHVDEVHPLVMQFRILRELFGDPVRDCKSVCYDTYHRLKQGS